MNKLQKYVIPALMVLAVLATGVAAVAHHKNQTKKQEVVQASAADQAKQAQYKADKAAQAIIVDSYNKLQLECVKGANLYATLTPVVKAKIPAPDCGKPLVQ